MLDRRVMLVKCIVNVGVDRPEVLFESRQEGRDGRFGDREDPPDDVADALLFARPKETGDDTAGVRFEQDWQALYLDWHAFFLSR